MLVTNIKVPQTCEKIQVSKLDLPTELWLYVGALILKDKTMVSQKPLQINAQITK